MGLRGQRIQYCMLHHLSYSRRFIYLHFFFFTQSAYGIDHDLAATVVLVIKVFLVGVKVLDSNYTLYNILKKYDLLYNKGQSIFLQ